MTVRVNALFETAQIPNANTVLYTAPANTRTIIDKMTVTNTTGGALTVTVFLVPSGGAANAGTTVISAQSVASNSTILCSEVVGHILNPGDAIVAIASAAASLTGRASGREVS